MSVMHWRIALASLSGDAVIAIVAKSQRHPMKKIAFFSTDLGLLDFLSLTGSLLMASTRLVILSQAFTWSFDQPDAICGEIRGVMRYCIILANMVWIKPRNALVYIVHELVAEGCTHQRGEYCVLLTSTRFQHVDNVNFLNLSFGSCRRPNLVL